MSECGENCDCKKEETKVPTKKDMLADALEISWKEFKTRHMVNAKYLGKVRNAFTHGFLSAVEVLGSNIVKKELKGIDEHFPGKANE